MLVFGSPGLGSCPEAGALWWGQGDRFRRLSVSGSGPVGSEGLVWLMPPGLCLCQEPAGPNFAQPLILYPILQTAGRSLHILAGTDAGLQVGGEPMPRAAFKE